MKSGNEIFFALSKPCDIMILKKRGDLLIVKNVELFCNVGDFVYFKTYTTPMRARVYRISIDEDGATYYTEGIALRYFNERDIDVGVFDTDFPYRQECHFLV